MGAFFSWLYRVFGGTKKISVSIVGLEKAGKSTLAKALCLEKTGEEYEKTMELDCKLFKREGCSVTVYDLGGQKHFRKKWEEYVDRSDCVVFVFDCAEKDEEKVKESVEEFEKMMNAMKNKDKPVLFCSNKIDIIKHYPMTEVLEMFKIDKEFDEYSILAIEISSLKLMNIGKIVKWIVGL